MIPTNASLPNELNKFYARFEATNTEPSKRAAPAGSQLITFFFIFKSVTDWFMMILILKVLGAWFLFEDDQVLMLSEADMRKTLQRGNTQKAAGPDSTPGHILRACSDQLAGIFTDIFNMSLSQAVVTTCFKSTTTIPVPKKTKVTCLNDHRPVALTPS